MCVNYADFLVETLPRNKALFDRIVVVTSYGDLETQKVCEWEHVECIRVTDAHLGIGKGHFNKGRAINAGLRALDVPGRTGDYWVAQLDADVALPPQARVVLENTKLDPGFIYGTDRFKVEGYKAWRKFCRRPQLQHENGVYVHLDAFKLGTRFISPSFDGYIPIGFFQLWHPTASQVTVYPQGHTDAGRTDMLFANNWPRVRRALLPELVLYHLESDPTAAQGVNWAGRQTPPFEARHWWTGAVNWWRRHRHRHHHHHHHHPHPPPPDPYLPHPKEVA